MQVHRATRSFRQTFFFICVVGDQAHKFTAPRGRANKQSLERYYFDQVIGQLEICQLDTAFLCVAHVDSTTNKVAALHIERIERDQTYWTEKLLPNLQYTYSNLLLPLLLLQHRGERKTGSLDFQDPGGFSRCVQDRLVSNDPWTLCSPELAQLHAFDLARDQMEALMAYSGVSRMKKSTMENAKRYLEGPDSKMSEQVFFAEVNGCPTFVFSSTGSFRTQRGVQRCYTVVLTFSRGVRNNNGHGSEGGDASENTIYTFCTCKNGASGKCSHIAAALLLLYRHRNGLEPHPIRAYIAKVMNACPNLTMSNKNTANASR